MIVTDKAYSMEKKLVEKLDLACKRLKNKLDCLMLVDGDEGYGKSTISGEMGYYVAYKLGRKFSYENFFFNIDKLIEYATKTEKQVIIWDEAALGGLAMEWGNKLQQKLIKLLMISRKKNHFYFFNIPKFFKLNEYIVVDRATALIHVYARQEIQRGRFVYFRKQSKEKLFFDWRKARKRSYKINYNFRGSFPDALSKIIDINKYDANKDEAIMSIDSSDGISRKEFKLLLRHYQIATLPEVSTSKKAEHFDVDLSTVYDWGKLPQKYPILLGNEVI